jgi:hypothetical protein
MNHFYRPPLNNLVWNKTLVLLGVCVIVNINISSSNSFFEEET